MCFEKNVIFERPRDEDFRFDGSNIKAFLHLISAALLHLISAMQAERLMKKKTCRGYLVSLASTIKRVNIG